jgi:hypothetical protein
LLLSGGLLERDVPSLVLHRINGDSAENHRHMDEKSTRVKFFGRELLDHEREFCLNNVYSAGNYTRSGTRNPPEEWHSAGNYQLIDEESTRGRGFHRELLAHLQ